MNILIPHSWLLEHLETDASPAEIQKYVSLCGPSIERIYKREGEAVYDIEVTTNRVDSMSVRGIAREVAVILSQFGKKSKLKPLKFKKILNAKTATGAAAKSLLPLPQIIDSDHLCQRTMCIVLANTERTPTPEWMARRLRQIEISVHDAVIDITNYITHELGHPCHAFDYDRIMELGEGSIIVTTAKAGQKFTTLDNASYTTVGGEVVYTSPSGEIIDLPGIKGTANTSINQSTKNVLFWIESIDAKKIRFASMTHAIRTVAAQLNEKHVDPYLAEPVFERGVALFEELTNAKVASQLHDHFPHPHKLAPVTVSLTRIHEYLGIELPVNTIAKILEKLECEVTLKGGKKGEPSLVVTPPTFRSDIQIPADVIEEVARIYGYHNLPSVIMNTAIPLDKPAGTNFAIEDRIKRFFSTLGWQELFTYSMVSAEVAAQSGYALDTHLKISNPLTDDRVYLRRSLFPSLEEVIATNSQHKDLSIFEVANVYHPQPTGLPSEKLILGMVSVRPYREVKGMLEALLRQFFITEYAVTPSTGTGFAQVAEVAVNDETGKTLVIGQIGVLPSGHTAIGIEVAEFLRVIKSHPTYQPLPKTSEVIEDLTFTLPAKTEIGSLLQDLKKQSSLIRALELGSVYQHNFTIRLTYHDPEKNVSMEEVGPVRKALVAYVEQKWQGQLVGKLA